MFYVQLDYELEQSQIAILLLAIVYMCVVAMRLYNMTFYDQSVHLTVFGVEIFLFWMSFCNFIQTFFDNQSHSSLGELYAYILSPLVIMIFFIQSRKYLNQLLKMKIPIDVNRSYELYNVIQSLLLKIKNFKKGRDKIDLLGNIYYHQRYCAEPECSTKKYIDRQLSMVSGASEGDMH